MKDWEDIGERIFLRTAKDLIRSTYPKVPWPEGDIPFPKKPPPAEPETRNLANLQAYNEELKAHVHEQKALLKAGDALLEEFAQYSEHLEAEWEGMPKTKFQVALRFHADGVSTGPLIECLRSDDQLTADDRESLATFFERRGPGRSSEAHVKRAAALARQLYRDWKLANLEAGINDWGVGDLMKDRSCEYAIEIEEIKKSGERVSFDAVRLLMDRPVSRRKTITPHRGQPYTRT